MMLFEGHLELSRTSDGHPPGLGAFLGSEPLQHWADRVVCVPAVVGVQVRLEQAGLAGELTASAGPKRIFTNPGNGARRRAWGRAAGLPARRLRELHSEDDRWSATLTVEFTGDDSGLSDAIVDVLTDGLAAELRLAHTVAVAGGENLELVRYRDAANQNGRAFDLAFEEAVVGMALVPLDLPDDARLMKVNDRLRHISGCSDEELTSRRFVELLHPDDRRPQESAFRRVRAGRRAPFQSEGRLLRGDGSHTWVRVTGAPLLDDMGDPTHLLVQVEELLQRGAPEVEQAERLDELTGLLKVGAFETATGVVQDRAHRRGDPAAIYIAQIEDWDKLVSAYGVGVADEVQRQVAGRLRATLRVDDAIGSLEDNQFAFLAEEITIGDAASLAERVRAALAPSVTVQGQDVAVQVRLGAAMIGANHSTPTELRQAALAAAERVTLAVRADPLSSRFEIDPNGLIEVGADLDPTGPAMAQIYRHRRR